MNRRLPALAFALAFASSVGVAEAGHVHFSGGVHFSTGVRVHARVHVGGGIHWSRPAWHPHSWGIRGHIYVGGYYPYYYRPYYYYYYPESVPSYYSGSYYPVVAGGPSVQATYVPPPQLPRFGIGLFAGAVSTQDTAGDSQHESSDVGVIGRLRLGNGGLLVEGELGKSSYDVQNESNVRVDRRLGGSLIYEIGAHNALAPYALVGLGVQQADVGGEYSTTQDYAEIGAGLRWAITPHFHLTADIRAGSRSTVDNDEVQPGGTAVRSVTPPTTDSDKNEGYKRVRAAAIVFF